MDEFLNSFIKSICCYNTATKSYVLLFNCSWTKFIAIIVNVGVFFWVKFLLDGFDFSNDFYALDFFCVSRDLKFSQSQFQAAELNWRQFNTKSQLKIAPKLVSFSL